MTTFLVILVVILGSALAVMYFLKQRAEAAIAGARQQAAAAQQQRDEEVARARRDALAATTQAEVLFQQKVAEQNVESERIRKHYEMEAIKACDIANEKIARAREEARATMLSTHQAFEQKSAELDAHSERIREHYEMEARKALDAANEQLSQALTELEPLRTYSTLKDAEAEVKETLTQAMAEATALRQEAQALLEQTRSSTSEERQQAQQRAREIRGQAEVLLAQATSDAGRIVTEAEKRAEQIAGDAYVALRDKHVLEQAVNALWNVVEGYGDRYIVPTRSLLDDLAADFGHTEAGEALKAAREQSRRMVELRQAATCNYVEEDRHERANRFVVDAFNGRVDAILTRTKHDNYGTLEQEIRDAFSLVNLNGIAFRDARILPAYLDARLAELKWAVIVQELKLKAREEQRRIQEQMREEEKVRREQERAIKEAQDKEQAIEDALVKARLDAEHATAQERSKYDAQIAELNERLAEAITVKEREISMAQLTRAGNVYIISNIGSFGEEVIKIGMTRRRDPMDRIWELSDASVPFDFDVHAMISSEDAPALERMLHEAFDDLRINKVNFRKEFFRIPLQRIHDFAAEKGLKATFTMVADAREYRETTALAKMTPEEREKYHLRQAMEDDLSDE